MELIDQTLTIDTTKSLIDEAVAYLGSTNDYGTKEVEDAIEMLGIIPHILVDDIHSYRHNSFLDQDTVQFRTRRYKVTQYLIQQGFPSIVVKMIKSLHENLSSPIKSEQSGDQFGTNLKALCDIIMNHTSNYPMPSAPYCRAICKEGAVEILAQSLLYFDDSDSNIAQKTTIFVEMKTAILGVLFNIITECPDYREKYRSANIVDALSKIQKTNIEVERLSLLVLAYIVDENENEMLVNSQDSVQSLIRLFAKAVSSPKHTVKVDDCEDDGIYDCRELLSGLNHLAIHDTNKDVIVKHGGIPSIIRMLQSDFSEDERQLAAETLGTLALKDDIKENPEIQKAMSGNAIPHFHTYTLILRIGTISTFPYVISTFQLIFYISSTNVIANVWTYIFF